MQVLAAKEQTESLHLTAADHRSPLVVVVVVVVTNRVISMPERRPDGWRQSSS